MITNEEILKVIMGIEISFCKMSSINFTMKEQRIMHKALNLSGLLTTEAIIEKNTYKGKNDLINFIKYCFNRYKQLFIDLRYKTSVNATGVYNRMVEYIEDMLIESAIEEFIIDYDIRRS